MSSQKVIVQKLLKGNIKFKLPLIEQALLNDDFRSQLKKELTDYIMVNAKAPTALRLPDQVRQDKVDIAKALLESADQAMERKQISRNVLHRLLKTFLIKIILRQDDEAEKAAKRFAQRHEGIPPSTIVISPTKTCNLHCSGCYANSGPSDERLEWDVFDRILTEAKELWGLRFFTISGGEPLAYRSQSKDLIDMVTKHSDCFFHMYTNGTLIDKGMAERLAGAGNLIPAISVEGFETRTDERRGEGIYQRILEAMANLRNAGVPFGISLTATRNNAEEILSDEFINFFFDEQQAVFGWIFQYMPIGRCFTLDLQVTPEQRLWMWKRTWQIIRQRKIFLADFWNCGTVADGCIAAGQGYGGGYFYIDWNGKVMPCAFVPYSAGNIHEIYRSGGTLDDVYEFPYFKAIRKWQRDYALGKERAEECGNLLLPCSLRDHYASGHELIEKYHPEPEDEAADNALRDSEYYKGMVEYDEKLRKLFDPIWESEYLKKAVAIEHVK